MPRPGGEGVEPGGVGIQLAEVDGRIAGNVADDEEDHHLAGDGHQELSAD